MKKESPYSVLAKCYDDFAGEDRYKKWKLLLEKIIKKHKIKLDFAVDLACGTGTNTKTLRDLGFFKVFGVDKSQEMLDQAKSKDEDILFFRKDFLNFSGEEFKNISLVTCFYDSLNYLLKEKELQKAFSNVYKSLKKGGVFVFDLNAHGHIKGVFNNKPSVLTKEDLFIIINHKCKDDFWILDLSIFTREKDNLFSLFKERHVEKMYDRETVIRLLKKVGFKILKTKKEEKKYQDGETYNNRIYYIAKK